jgi:endonuclease/exonuclease/phosphatase (EEP) superfamily protein YafD
VKPRAVVAWGLVAVCAAWAVVRALGLERGYPMVPLIAYTPAAAAGTAGVAILCALLRRRWAALAAVALAVLLASFVVPRALGGPSAAEGGRGPQLRVLTANLYRQSRAATSLVALARETRADVVSIHELTPEVADALRAAGMRELLPESALEERPDGFGSGLYTRAPLEDLPAPGGKAVSAGRLRIRGAAPVEIYAVHPRAPLGPAEMDEWKAHLRALPPATPGGELRILAGDFNATLDHAELRRILATGYEDAAAEVGSGLRATWPSNRRFPPPVTIDHVLADARCGVREVRVFDVAGSDHRAVLAVLELPRG